MIWKQKQNKTKISYCDLFRVVSFVARHIVVSCTQFTGVRVYLQESSYKSWVLITEIEVVFLLVDYSSAVISSASDLISTPSVTTFLLKICFREWQKLFFESLLPGYWQVNPFIVWWNTNSKIWPSKKQSFYSMRSIGRSPHQHFYFIKFQCKWKFSFIYLYIYISFSTSNLQISSCYWLLLHFLLWVASAFSINRWLHREMARMNSVPIFTVVQVKANTITLA